MIKEKEVFVKINNKNMHYYEEMGYEIPKYKNKQGKMVIKRGTKILVKIDDLTKGSGVKVTKICDFCGKEVPNSAYNDIMSKREKTDGKDRCFDCAFKQNKEKGMTLLYEDSLEYYALRNNKEYLLKEFSNKNTNAPKEIAKFSNKEYIWNCLKCGSEYSMQVSSRTSRGLNCPYCHGKRVNHTNCLWTTHPEIAKLLVDSELGYKVTHGSDKKANFKCLNCRNIDKRIIRNVAKNGFICKICSDGISYPEKFVSNFLYQLNVYYEKEKSFEWAKNKFYDFYIPSLNMIIEVNGEQHYKKRKKIRGRSYLEEQENDKLKEKLAKENGIKYYIILDCRESTINYIKNSILKSKLSNIFHLEQIDWLECHRFACSTLVKKASDLWNEGIKNTKEIGKIMKISSTTVVRYLKQGVELGWCNYDPNREKFRPKITRSVIQLSLEDDFIKEWNSIKEAAKELGFASSSSIIAACKGEYKAAGGYKWMYKEDYILMRNK